MYTKGLVSIIIPSRNEPYLAKTIRDVLEKATGQIEVIAVLEGYWDQDIVDDKRVIYLRHGVAQGMRAAINHGVAISHGEYILKTDAHTLWDANYDQLLKGDMQENWVVVPRRYRLDVENWTVIADGRPPVDYEYLDAKDLHGIRWEEKAIERKDVMVDEIISAQGSAWFTTRKHFDNIGGLDEENYGTFFLEFQELAFKTYAIGGKCMVNKKTMYSHWHKPKDHGRGYDVGKGEREKATEYMKLWRENKAFDKQTVKFEDIIRQFLPMPGWSDFI